MCLFSIRGELVCLSMFCMGERVRQKLFAAWVILQQNIGEYELLCGC